MNFRDINSIEDLVKKAEKDPFIEEGLMDYEDEENNKEQEKMDLWETSDDIISRKRFNDLYGDNSSINKLYVDEDDSNNFDSKKLDAVRELFYDFDQRLIDRETFTNMARSILYGAKKVPGVSLTSDED